MGDTEGAGFHLSIPKVSILPTQSFVLSINPKIKRIDTKIKWIHHMKQLHSTTVQ